MVSAGRQQFLNRYLNPEISGMPTPVDEGPVHVDKSWYMSDEGPGRFYHPGMFPVIHQISRNQGLAPGTYDLQDFIPPDKDEKDSPAVTTLSNYFTEMGSPDYWQRAFIFGNESAKIFGKMTVNPDHSKTFHQIEIRPRDTDFDFEPNTGNQVIEAARAWARRRYDPDNLGIQYKIRYRGPRGDSDIGTGRKYQPFTGIQLYNAMAAERLRPGTSPTGLLPSFTDYEMNRDDQQPSRPAGMPAPPPTQPGSQPQARPLGPITNEPMPDWPVPPPIFNSR